MSTDTKQVPIPKVEYGRHATWTELFYDLAYVASIAVITHQFSHHLTWATGVHFLAHLIPVWLLWLYGTYFAGWFEVDDLGHKFSILLQMIGIVGLAIFSHGEIGLHFKGFIISYVVVRISIIFNFMRVGHHYPGIKKSTKTYAIGNSVGLIGWLLALIPDGNLAFVFAGSGLVLDYITPFFATRHTRKLPIDIPHLLERFGLFTLITLGECITAIVAGVTVSHMNAYSVICGIFGMIIAFTIWRLYFETIEQLEDHFKTIYKRRRKGVAPKSNMIKFLRNYSIVLGHLALVIGVSTLAAGFNLIISSGHEHLHESSLFVFSIGGMLCFMAIAIMEINAKNIERSRKIRYMRSFSKISMAFLILMIGTLRIFHEAIYILGSITALCVALLVVNIIMDIQDKKKFLKPE